MPGAPCRYCRRERKTMLELLIIGAFVVLFGKAFGLVWKLTWGVAKLVAGLALGLAVPALVLCLVFAGSVAMLVPLAVIGLVFFLLKKMITGR